MNNLDKVFVDASCVIEILLGREKLDYVIKKIEIYEKAYISTLSLHLAFHFGRKEQINYEDIVFLIEQFLILDFTEQNYQTAKIIIKNNDFEDALQLATAKDNEIANILTLDSKMSKVYGKKFNFV
jgi:predicted nucleic acid-binding protein